MRGKAALPISVKNNILCVSGEFVDGYFSPFVADYIRNNMLNVVPQFTIETVLSDKRKLEYIECAKRLGVSYEAFDNKELWSHN